MSYETVRKAIAVSVNNNWNQSAYPLFEENQGEQQPTAVFGRFSIRPIDAVSQSAGGYGLRVTGLLWFQIFLQEGQGVSDAMKFADAIKALFDNQVLATDDGEQILFRRTELAYIGVEPSGRPMWRATVRYQVDGE